MEKHKIRSYSHNIHFETMHTYIGHIILQISLATFLIVHSVFFNVSNACPFLIVPSVFSNVSNACPFLIVTSVFSNVSDASPFLVVPSVFSNVSIAYLQYLLHIVSMISYLLFSFLIYLLCKITI
jgi:hypothetical protein